MRAKMESPAQSSADKRRVADTGQGQGKPGWARPHSVMWYGTLNTVRWRREIPRSQGICTPAQSAERASEKSQGEMTQGCPQLAKKVTARLEAGKSPLVPSPVLSPPTLT